PGVDVADLDVLEDQGGSRRRSECQCASRKHEDARMHDGGLSMVPSRVQWCQATTPRCQMTGKSGKFCPNAKVGRVLEKKAGLAGRPTGGRPTPQKSGVSVCGAGLRPARTPCRPEARTTTKP